MNEITDSLNSTELTALLNVINALNNAEEVSFKVTVFDRDGEEWGVITDEGDEGYAFAINNEDEAYNGPVGDTYCALCNTTPCQNLRQPRW